MRLVRSVQVAIGLTAAGGMAVVLSGSALAADGGLATTSQTTLTTSTQTVSTSGGGSVVVVSQDDTSQPGSGTGQSQGDSGTSTSDSNLSGTATKSDKSAATDSSGKTETTSAVQASGSSEGASAGTTTVQVFGEITKAPQEASANEKGGTEDGAAATISLAGSAPAEAVMEQSQAVRTTVLTLQPTITNRVKPLVVDLATAVPSAATPAKAPAPAKSTGLLGHLRAELAGTMIPQPVMLHALEAGSMMFAINLLALIILLANVFTFTYGLWLRRGGYATAARSDAPNSTLSVATPYLLGYASLPLRIHSPLFNGGRNEIKTVSYVPNALRKEERL